MSRDSIRHTQNDLSCAPREGTVFRRVQIPPGNFHFGR
jgi:hypothetical protein